MADSEKKTQAESNPPETALVLVKGEPRELMRGANGRWAKKPKPLIPTIEFTRSERKALNSASSTKEGLTEYMHAFLNLVRIAQYDGDDPKGMMAAVKAFEVIRLSALGKPSPSEQEIDKLTNQPVKTVIVVAPSLMHPEIVQEKLEGEKKTQPSAKFLEVVSVETNPAK